MTTPALAQNVKGKGRHYAVPGSDVLVPSVTNVIGTLNKPALVGWAARLVAETAASLKTSLASMEDDEVVDLLKGAPFRKTTKAAGRGTDVHTLVEDRLNGVDSLVDPTGETRKYLRSIDKFFTEHEVSARHTEVTLFGDGYAGTADFVGHIDGTLVLADWKSGKGLYDEVALQLAALAGCSTMVVDGETVKTPKVDGLVAVAFTEKGYVIKHVVDRENAYRAFLSLLDVWRWKHGGGVLGEGSAPPPQGGDGDGAARADERSSASAA